MHIKTRNDTVIKLSRLYTGQPPHVKFDKLMFDRCLYFVRVPVQNSRQMKGFLSRPEQSSKARSLNRPGCIIKTIEYSAHKYLNQVTASE